MNAYSIRSLYFQVNNTSGFNNAYIILHIVTYICFKTCNQSSLNPNFVAAHCSRTMVVRPGQNRQYHGAVWCDNAEMLQ